MNNKVYLFPDLISNSSFLLQMTVNLNTIVGALWHSFWAEYISSSAISFSQCP